MRGLTPPVGPGRTQFTSGWELERAVKALLGRAGRDGAVDGDLGAARDRPGALRGPRPRRPEAAQDDGAERPLSDHLGDARRRGDRTPGGADGLAGAGDQRATASRLSLGDSVLGYRAGTCVERAFHQLKDQPLGIRPLLRAS